MTSLVAPNVSLRPAKIGVPVRPNTAPGESILHPSESSAADPFGRSAQLPSLPDQEVQLERLMQLSSRDPICALKRLRRLGVQDEHEVFRVTMAAARANPREVVRRWDLVTIADESLRRDLAKYCFRKVWKDGLATVPRLGLSASGLEDLAAHCAERSGLELAKHYDLFGVRSEEFRLRHAKIALRTSDGAAAEFLPLFRLTDRTELFALARNVLQQTNGRALKYLDKFGDFSAEEKLTLWKDVFRLRPECAVEAASTLKVGTSSAGKAAAKELAPVDFSEFAENLAVFGVSSGDFFEIAEVALDGQAKNVFSFLHDRAALSHLVPLTLPETEIRNFILDHLSRFAASVAESGVIGSGLFDRATQLSLAEIVAQHAPNEVIENFDALALTESEDRLKLATILHSVDPDLAWTSHGSFRLQERDLARFAQLHCAVDPAAALDSDAASHALWSTPEVLSLITVSLLQRGQIEPALKACMLEKSGPRAVIPIAEAFEVFDRHLLGLEGQLPSLDPLSAERIGLLARLRRAKLSPSSRLLTALEQLPPQDREFGCGLVLSTGVSLGAALVRAVCGYLGNRAGLTDGERSAITALAETGYAGVTPKKFALWMEAFSRLPAEAQSLVRKWRKEASEVMLGGEVEEGLTDEEAMSRIFAAYRPPATYGHSAESWLHTYRKVRSRQQDLQGFVFPEDGYSLEIVGLAGLALRDGTEPDLGAIQNLEKTFLGPVAVEERSSPHGTAKMARAVLTGDSGAIDIPTLSALIEKLAGSDEFGAAREKLAAILARPSSLETVYSRLRLLDELLAAPWADAGAAAARKLAPLLSLSPKQQAVIAKRLRRDPNEPLSDEQVASVLALNITALARPSQGEVRRELKKIVASSGEKPRSLLMVVSKSRPAFFSRASAGLCTAWDLWSWNNPNFLQMLIADPERHRLEGNIQLHVFDHPNGGRGVIARVNPNQGMIEHCNPTSLIEGILGNIVKFATDNNLIPYLPEQGGFLSLSNRPQLVPLLQRAYGSPLTHAVRITEHKTVSKLHKIDLERYRKVPTEGAQI